MRAIIPRNHVKVKHYAYLVSSSWNSSRLPHNKLPHNSLPNNKQQATQQAPHNNLPNNKLPQNNILPHNKQQAAQFENPPWWRRGDRNASAEVAEREKVENADKCARASKYVRLKSFDTLSPNH